MNKIIGINSLDEKKLPSRTISFVASVLSMGEQDIPNDIYMTIKMRMLTTKPNLNGVSVTERFIDNIVENQERYKCIPLCADVHKIEGGDLAGLGHMLDFSTGTFYSQQIGSFYSFEKVVDAYGVAQIGTARVAKRNVKVMEALTKLFSQGLLSFSFEILAGETSQAGGVEVIDVSDRNHLIAMAIVSKPADTSARALALVAEIDMQKGFEKAFKHTKHVDVAEVSIHTLNDWVYRAMYAWFGDEAYCFSIDRVCPDCAILYDNQSGRTYKMEYIAKNEALVITDIYEVIFARKDGVDELDKLNMETVELQEIAEETMTEANHTHSQTHTHALQSTIETAEDQPIEPAQEQPVEPVEECSSEAEDVVKEIEQASQEVAAVDLEAQKEEESIPEIASTQEEIEIDSLAMRIKTLEEMIEKQGLIIASYEQHENVKKASLVAQRAGLDMDAEEVKAAIAAADFAKVATLVAQEEPQEKAPETAANPFVSEMKVQKRDYSYMFEPVGK